MGKLIRKRDIRSAVSPDSVMGPVLKPVVAGHLCCDQAIIPGSESVISDGISSVLLCPHQAERSTVIHVRAIT